LYETNHPAEHMGQWQFVIANKVIIATVEFGFLPKMNEKFLLLKDQQKYRKYVLVVV
jgi:hypothetical protein